MPPAGNALRLGVSRCLLGEEVRYNGGHQFDHFVAVRLGPLVEWVELCPEFDFGMGAPRPAIEMRGSVEDPRICEVETGRDLTETFGAWCVNRATEMTALDLDGCILKSESPSCGLRDVPFFEGGRPRASGHGIFARAVENIDPTLPLCREDDLRDESSRRRFFLRALSRHRARAVTAMEGGGGEATDALAREFLDHHRLALVAREIPWEDALGTWSGLGSWRAVQEWLAQQLKVPETLEGNVRALNTAVEWLDRVDPSHWFAFAPMLEEVRRGSMPAQVLRVTIHLVARCHRSARLTQQLYLHPWLCDRPGNAVKSATLR